MFADGEWETSMSPIEYQDEAEKLKTLKMSEQVCRAVAGGLRRPDEAPYAPGQAEEGVGLLRVCVMRRGWATTGSKRCMVLHTFAKPAGEATSRCACAAHQLWPRSPTSLQDFRNVVGLINMVMDKREDEEGKQ